MHQTTSGTSYQAVRLVSGTVSFDSSRDNYDSTSKSVRRHVPDLLTISHNFFPDGQEIRDDMKDANDSESRSEEDGSDIDPSPEAFSAHQVN
jgi:hypothetical protein